METWTEKIIIGILLVAVGWLFGQGGKLVEEWRVNRRTKRQLLEELEHIQATLRVANQSFLRTLQLSVLNIAELDTSQRFSHPIFDGFYKDVCSSLNKSQRASYELIRQLIDAINQMYTVQSDCARSTVLKPEHQDWTWWKTLARFQYVNFHELDYLIANHLCNREKPGIELGEISHRDYLKNSQLIENELAKIVRCEVYRSEGRERSISP